jgi:hypothetical protein
VNRGKQGRRPEQEIGVNGDEAARVARYRQSTDIRRIACDVFGATVVDVPAGRGVLAVRQLDDPLAGVRAAAFVQSVARAELYNHTVQARAAGQSWHEIAAALGLGEDHGTRPRWPSRWSSKAMRCSGTVPSGGRPHVGPA